MERNLVFKCAACGNIVEILHVGTCVPFCCGKEMDQLAENSTDGAKEKHVPIIEKKADGYLVKVGSVAHPMLDAHYIEWIELIAGEDRYKHYLAPGQAPEAFFPVKADKVSAREYCNLHGLWRA